LIGGFAMSPYAFIETILYADGFGGNSASLMQRGNDWLVQAYGQDPCIYSCEAHAREAFQCVKDYIDDSGFRILEAA